MKVASALAAVLAASLNVAQLSASGMTDPAFDVAHVKRDIDATVDRQYAHLDALYPLFAPVPEPTIRTGVIVLTLAVLMVSTG